MEVDVSANVTDGPARQPQRKPVGKTLGTCRPTSVYV